MKHIETVQGTDKDGNVFGYDHKRHYFIVWGIDISTDKIVIEKIEPDETSATHGSIKATWRDAAKVASAHNRMWGSGLRSRILMSKWK